MIHDVDGRDKPGHDGNGAVISAILLCAYFVMPNHVHVLTVFRVDFRLPDVVRSWKGNSARQINARLGRQGAFWQKDYFDRYVRDEAHFERVRAYIENNPVAAD